MEQVSHRDLGVKDSMALGVKEGETSFTGVAAKLKIYLGVSSICRTCSSTWGNMSMQWPWQVPLKA